MKRVTIMTLLIAAVIMTAGYSLVQAHGGYSSSWGHMGGYGHMMDYGDYLDSSCWSTPREVVSKDISKDEAQEMIAWHLRRTNDRLKVGKVMETEDGFEVQVVTRKGEALVDKLLVERDTGKIYRVYE